jgi:chemotaxis signal transduction protein
MASSAKIAGLASAVAELIEQRARLEDRLDDFYRVASTLGQQPLPPGASGALADLKTAISRFDGDLTRLANAVHVVTESAVPELKAVVQVLFVRCGEQQFALPVRDVKEVRPWDAKRGQGWRDREVSVLKLESALQLESYVPPVSRKLVALNSPPGAALLVDEILRQDELMLRPMSPLVAGPYLGAVSGLHGELVLVVDTFALLSSSAALR